MFHGVRVGSGLQTDITFVATLYASTPCRSAGTVIYSITARHGIRVVSERESKVSQSVRSLHQGYKTFSEAKWEIIV